MKDSFRMSTLTILIVIKLCGAIDAFPTCKTLTETSGFHQYSKEKNQPSEVHRFRRAAVARKERLWDFGVIPYEIDPNFGAGHKKLFKYAMKHWENHTCIQFVERIPNEHKNYIFFTVLSCGCCSYVGKRGNGSQSISIGKDCAKFGIVVHELGHAIGFWHEHTRPDRDQYVKILRENIPNGQEHNFNKLTADDVNSLGEPYDYCSIMHYARNTYSQSRYKDTIQPMNNDGCSSDIGQRKRLSRGDILQANKLYQCARCGRTFQGSRAAFSPPTIAKSCEWRISANPGEKIELNITDFDVFDSTNCESDYLEIFDGYWHKSPVLARYCGKHASITIKSSGNRMLLNYVRMSDESKGFIANYETVCGGDIAMEQSDLTIESPNYPLPYLPNKECVWRVFAPADYEVALTFNSFELEAHANCLLDYMEVRDGDSEQARLIGIYCGNQLPPVLRSTTNKMYIKFVADASGANAGFSAKFVKELDECELKDHGCEHDCINTLGGYKCACRIGYQLRNDSKTCEVTCGGIIKASNGTITSPFYPYPYPPGEACIWEIVAEQPHRITLNFTYFELEGNNFFQQECHYDSLAVFSRWDSNESKLQKVFCGERLPRPITSESNIMRIEFRSDRTVQKTGFSAVFSTSMDECAVDNGGCMHECRNTFDSFQCYCRTGYVLHENGLDCIPGGCKYEITAPNGTITSKNYPNNYDKNMDCIWHFKSTPGHRVQLKFQKFDTEFDQECSNDFVTVYIDVGRYDDPTDTYTFGKYCGNSVPNKILAPSDEMFMIFRSDDSVQRQGFIATHSTVCGGHLNATNEVQYFYSHAQFGDKNYDHKTDCDWIVQALPGRSVHLVFETFDVEDEQACSYDFVDIYEGPNDHNGLLYGRYCGSNRPLETVSIRETLLVRFRSDDTMNKKGFSVTYVSVDSAAVRDNSSSKFSKLRDTDIINSDHNDYIDEDDYY